MYDHPTSNDLCQVGNSLRRKSAVLLHFPRCPSVHTVTLVEGMKEMRRSTPTATELTLQTIAPARGSSADRGSKAFDDRGRTVAWIARTVHRLYDAEAQKILDRETIPIAHWYYLRVLVERGELNQLELSKRVGIASTTAVPALDNMEKRGLLKRIRDPKDRRKYYVRLTESGRQLVDRLLPEITRMFTASVDEIASEDMHIFWRVMHEIERKLSEASHGHAMLD
jgi:MarR family transcriptional regulator for hemolysin